MNFNDLIDRYITGKLSGEDLKIFKEELQKNKKLQAEVQSRKGLLPGLELAYKENLKKKFSDFSARQESKTPDVIGPARAKVIPMRRYLAVAASVAVLVVLGGVIYQWVFAGVDREEIYAQYEEFPLEINIRENLRNSNSADNTSANQIAYDNWVEAGKAYKQKDFVKTVTLLEKINYRDLEKEDQGLFLFHLGLLKMRQGQYQEALSIFNREETGSTYAKQWNRALLLLKTGASKEDLVAVFTKIAESNVNNYNQDAQKVLKILDDLKE